MKIEKLLEQNDHSRLRSDFIKGAPLSDDVNDKYVIIYRAQPSKFDMLPTDSYVTRSLKFAKDHTIHMANTEEEPHHVIRVMVKTYDVYHASNSGEYVYCGVPIKGKPVFMANPGDEFE